MADLVTGARGQAHITPKNDAVIHRGMMGVESCILDYGEKLAPALIPSQPTNIRILDGCGMMQGRFFEIEEGSYDTIAIPNGAQGYNRIDIVCAKITQNENGTQTFSWEVVQGTQTSGTPHPPTVAEHSLDDGDEFALMPIASVELEGVNIVAVETVATISTAGEHLSLDTDATEGVDKELTDALTSLGWLAEVFSGKLLLKKLLKKILSGLVVFGTDNSGYGWTYAKFLNKFYICWSRSRHSFNATNAIGSMYYTDYSTNVPNFVTAASVACFGGMEGSSWFVCNARVASNSLNYRLLSPTSRTGIEDNIVFLLIGTL